MVTKNIIYTFVFLFFLTACSKQDSNINIQENMDNLKKVSQKKWDQLSQQRIYFGHQSVGFNMIDGINIHLKENPNIKLRIEEGDSSSLFEHPIFAHSKNGQNTDPKSKIDAFYKIMESRIGDKVDMAGFKFCYVDFNSDTDVEDIFEHYKSRMKEITNKYPNVRIIHFTVPLKTLQSGPKAFVKKLLGKDIGIKDNTARQQFNTLLINQYNEQVIFDLAKHESTYPDGKREFTLINNKEIYSMVPTYTNDGGHLSKKGKLIIGSELLVFLANLSYGRQN